MGNGHPVAALVTTRQVADKFKLPYFNTVSFLWTHTFRSLEIPNLGVFQLKNGQNHSHFTPSKKWEPPEVSVPISQLPWWRRRWWWVIWEQNGSIETITLRRVSQSDCDKAWKSLQPSNGTTLLETVFSTTPQHSEMFCIKALKSCVDRKKRITCWPTSFILPVEEHICDQSLYTLYRINWAKLFTENSAMARLLDILRG